MIVIIALLEGRDEALSLYKMTFVWLIFVWFCACVVSGPRNFTVIMKHYSVFHSIVFLPQADKVDRLEVDNSKYRDKLRDLDYYKKRAEVRILACDTCNHHKRK